MYIAFAFFLCLPCFLAFLRPYMGSEYMFINPISISLKWPKLIFLLYSQNSIPAPYLDLKITKNVCSGFQFFKKSKTFLSFHTSTFHIFVILYVYSIYCGPRSLTSFCDLLVIMWMQFLLPPSCLDPLRTAPYSFAPKGFYNQ